MKTEVKKISYISDPVELFKKLTNSDRVEKVSLAFEGERFVPYITGDYYSQNGRRMWGNFVYTEGRWKEFGYIG